MTQYTQLSNKNPSGTILGQSSADKVGFFGKTAITLHSLPASLAATASSALQIAATNKIRNLLKDLGLGVV